MKIVFTAKGTNWDDKIDPRFGRTDFLLVYEEETDNLTFHDNRSIHTIGHGAGPKTAQKLFELNPDVLITGNGPGGNAVNILNRFNIEIYIGADGMTVREAYQQFKNNLLTKGG